LIENGILRGYLQDRLNAGLMKMPLTGNGRRESYAHIPMPRMTNTFMLAGKDAPEDIIRSVKKGLYAVSFGGGQVDITNGKFVFSASEAYLIEDGEVTAPVRGAEVQVGRGARGAHRIGIDGLHAHVQVGGGLLGHAQPAGDLLPGPAVGPGVVDLQGFQDLEQAAQGSHRPQSHLGVGAAAGRGQGRCLTFPEIHVVKIP
jgi:hypothetical protein